MENEASSASAPRGRGRGKSRGGLGKYLRARGRGRGGGRPAVFGQRLLLEAERLEDMDEEELAEVQKKYSRRQLGTNVDRYKEPEPELDSEGAYMRLVQTCLVYIEYMPQGRRLPNRKSTCLLSSNDSDSRITNPQLHHHPMRILR